MCKLFTVASGCYSCDPYDVEKCLLCKVGYYMDENGQCISVGKVLDMDLEEESYIELWIFAWVILLVY